MMHNPFQSYQTDPTLAAYAGMGNPFSLPYNAMQSPVTNPATLNPLAAAAGVNCPFTGASQLGQAGYAGIPNYGSIYPQQLQLSSWLTPQSGIPQGIGPNLGANWQNPYTVSAFQNPWIAAGLQTAVNLGVMLAYAATYAVAGVSSQRYVFLVGILPALIVFWIRRAVPEPAEWHAAMSTSKPPPMSDLFRGRARRITLLTIVVCACSLTAWWAFMFWTPQLMRQLPEIAGWTPADKNRLPALHWAC